MYRLYSVWLRTNNAAHFGLYAIIIARTMKVRPKLRLTAITPQICESEFEADLFVSQSKVMHGYMLRFAGLMSGVSKQVTIEMTDRERGTQTNTNIPTDWEQAGLGNENGSGGRLTAGAGETGLEVGAFMHNGPWEAPFSPVAGPFTGSSSPALKRTPHVSPLRRQSTFLSHNSPTAVSWVALCHYLDSFTAPCLWRARFCWGCCGSSLTFGFKYVACKLFDGLAVDKHWLN